MSPVNYCEVDLETLFMQELYGSCCPYVKGIVSRKFAMLLLVPLERKHFSASVLL
jgi:hypothetical protein